MINAILGKDSYRMLTSTIKIRSCSVGPKSTPLLLSLPFDRPDFFDGAGSGGVSNFADRDAEVESPADRDSAEDSVEVERRANWPAVIWWEDSACTSDSI